MAIAESDNEDAVDDELFSDNIDANKTRNELQIAKTKLGDFLDLIPAGLVIHQTHAIIFANSEAGRLIGIPSDLLVGHHIFDFIDGRDAEAVRATFQRCFSEHVAIRSLELKLLDVGGHERIVHISMSPLYWEGLPVINVVFSDITPLKQKEQQLYILSTTDSLTGAFNRRYFMDSASREFSFHLRHQAPLSVLVMDIDYFKKVNDTYGHAIGDEAIKAFVGCCIGVLRREDILGRMGGEEFAVLLPQTGLDGATAMAERLRRKVEAIELLFGSERVGFTVSIGGAEARPGDASIETGLIRADHALYVAKANGRNRVVFDP